MGAKVVSDLYEKEKISRSEADTLLSFCNNIGPAYFMGIIIPILHECGYQNTLPFVFGMYGIPAVYGIVMGRLHAAEIPDTPSAGVRPHTSGTPQISLAASLKRSCMDNTQSLILLGGYITFTNAFRIFLDLMPLSVNSKNLLSSFLEIIGGVQAVYTTTLLPDQKVFWIMTALCFGGISCIMQTSSFLERSGLSISHYLKHKVMTTLISAVYYFVLTRPF